jgi:protein ImuA
MKLSAAKPHRPDRPSGRQLSFGVSALDATLQGGLSRGAVHEFYAASPADTPATTGLGLALASKAAGQRRIIWIRQDMSSIETGSPHAAGLTSLGLDHRQFTLVKARDNRTALKAALEAARCTGAASIVMDVWGEHRLFDLTTSRRLFLAAKNSGATLLMLRAAAVPAPSAAETRWRIKTATSKAWPANAPGHPRFELSLLRRRSAQTFSNNSWCVEWNSDTRSFTLATPNANTNAGLAAKPALPRAVVPLPPHRQVDEEREDLRHAS